jgi:hypothetical protein
MFYVRYLLAEIGRRRGRTALALAVAVGLLHSGRPLQGSR